jgi:hypothetical protein
LKAGILCAFLNHVGVESNQPHGHAKGNQRMADDTSKTRYSHLLRNVVLTILLTAITPTIIVSLFILDEFRTSYEKKVHDHLELLVRKHKKNIDMFLEEKLMDIRMLAGANLSRFE